MFVTIYLWYFILFYLSWDPRNSIQNPLWRCIHVLEFPWIWGAPEIHPDSPSRWILSHGRHPKDPSQGRLERALAAKHYRRSQALLQELGQAVPEALRQSKQKWRNLNLLGQSKRTRGPWLLWTKLRHGVIIPLVALAIGIFIAHGNCMELPLTKQINGMW